MFHVIPGYRVVDREHVGCGGEDLVIDASESGIYGMLVVGGGLLRLDLFRRRLGCCDRRHRHVSSRVECVGAWI